QRVFSRGIAPDRIEFVCAGEQPVATACVCLHERETGTEAEIGWVAVLPEHQRRRLGAQVTLAACHRALEIGFRDVFLLTDDFRPPRDPLPPPAVKSSLNLGFQPDCWHETHAARWAALYEILLGKAIPH